MKLLITTQKVDKDDDILGFFHAWIKEFAAHYEEVLVIALYVGAYDLPKNVRVLSLGKEGGVSRIKYLKRFFSYILRERHSYDQVFVHMNTEYVVLGGLLWRLMGKKIALWYTHRQVTWKLRAAVAFSDVIFTAAKESLNLISPKIRVVGHGIEVEKFLCNEKIPGTPLQILHMGRITRIKNCDTLIEAAALLEGSGTPVNIVFAGETITPDDMLYKQELDVLTAKHRLADLVTFTPVGYHALHDVFARADVTVNLTPTGGIDKAVLSGFVARRPTFVSNSAFKELLGIYADRLIFNYRDAKDLTDKISTFLASPDRSKVLSNLSERVQKEFSVKHVIDEITNAIDH